MCVACGVPTAGYLRCSDCMLKFAEKVGIIVPGPFW